MGTGSGKMWKKFRMRNALVPENSQDRDIRTPGSEQDYESALTPRARVRSQADKHRPGMCKYWWAGQSTAEGPSPGQWPGNRGARQTSRKTETK